MWWTVRYLRRKIITAIYNVVECTEYVHFLLLSIYVQAINGSSIQSACMNLKINNKCWLLNAVIIAWNHQFDFWQQILLRKKNFVWDLSINGIGFSTLHRFFSLRDGVIRKIYLDWLSTQSLAVSKNSRLFFQNCRKG